MDRADDNGAFARVSTPFGLRRLGENAGNRQAESRYAGKNSMYLGHGERKSVPLTPQWQTQKKPHREQLLDANYLQLETPAALSLSVRRYFLSVLIALAVAWGLPSFGAPAKPLVVTSFTVIQDWSQVIGGNSFEIFNLVPAGSETHGFQLGPRHVKELRRADLIIGMSPSLEPWLEAWAKANDRTNHVLWLHSDSVLKSAHLTEVDPHVWTSPEKVKPMAQAIAGRLAKLTPVVNLEINVNQYLKEVERLDAELTGLFSSLPSHKRLLITQHPNLGHFAQHFGLKVAGTILTSSSGEAADPSARHFSDLLALVKKEHIRVIVTDADQNDAFARRLAQDSNLPPPLPLSFEYLAATGQPGDTWIKMMQLNGRKLHAALRDR